MTLLDVRVATIRACPWFAPYETPISDPKKVVVHNISAPRLRNNVEKAYEPSAREIPVQYGAPEPYQRMYRLDFERT